MSTVNAAGRADMPRQGLVPGKDIRVSARTALGRKGEDLAAEHLRRLGLVILERNWRCREGELDLLATDGRVLVVCEVKTRSGRGYGSPAESVTHDKQERIRGLALRWLAARRVSWCPVRFDVIAIDYPAGRQPRLRHVVGAF